MNKLKLVRTLEYYDVPQLFIAEDDNRASFLCMLYDIANDGELKIIGVTVDIHAANNMIYFYLKYYNAPGTDVSMPVKRVKFSKQIPKQESTTSLV